MTDNPLTPVSFEALIDCINGIGPRPAPSWTLAPGIYEELIALQLSLRSRWETYLFTKKRLAKIQKRRKR